MYRLYVPLNFNTLDEKTLPQYLAAVRQCDATRVFLCGLDYVFEDNSLLYTDPARVERIIRYFKDSGLEVGVWFSPLGHGSPLSHDQGSTGDAAYTSIEGIAGEYGSHGNCPRDERLAARLRDAVGRIAAMHPDIIMLDDDLRIQGRRRCYRLGCFCPQHLKEFYERLGEEIPRDRIEALMFTGGSNRYRSTYLRLMGDTLLDLARMLRKAVDEVDPTVRLGACAAPESWDLGTDPIELARAFAGDTKPFFRTIGAPYWNINVISVIESTRMQFAWSRGEDIEVFAEGDTYPRPRYNVPSKPLELFDLALAANGDGTGILGYMFDYTYPIDYETGYAARYIRNAPLRREVMALFQGKSPVGVRVFNVMHKVEDMVLPERHDARNVDRLLSSTFCPSNQLLSANAIPTTFEQDARYPVLVAGENANVIPLDALRQGAILDATAAEILMTRRGIDTGFVSMQEGGIASEHFIGEDATVYGIGDGCLRRMQCNERARVLSEFLPDRSASVYSYENADGMRFLVIGCDLFRLSADFSSCRGNTNFFNSYYRQRQMIEAIEWLGGRRLPATCVKNPNLYMLASSDGDAMSVLMLNVHLDDVLTPTLKLDRAYSDIRFVGCTGRLEGDTVYLSDIGPYGVAAVEVR
ncbi:MAG: hypothetical protein J6R04_01595 [Clostridia bacterium]|nr:hypothetical protein [Clostridia bacterium]